MAASGRSGGALDAAAPDAARHTAPYLFFSVLLM